MRHPQYDFLDARRTTLLNDVIKQWNQAFATFQRKSLLTDIASVQVTFDAFCTGQSVEDIKSLFVAEYIGYNTLLESFSQPETLTCP